ncbi:zinc ABC transporter substrate-binding protein [Sulfurovum sp.]|uniref:metal ABC transporter solute-binding protein, Zn/Mn family n=1 Tax=Sulfurovum sp. TaxID=1969726 RepID=UPI0025FB8212|nr:zinc ABC transporter substrate-binding protein [Sulfurovum sp.]
MKKIIFLSLLFTGFVFANINTVVSILPEKTFVEAIGGDKVNVSLMVLPGNSPHTYEPKPSQMKDVAQASLYFAIGVEFENVWLPKFRDLNPKMQVIDLGKNIDKRMMTEGDNDHGTSHMHEGHEHHGKDPHIWTAPENVKIIAKNIYSALIKVDPDNSAYYKKNYQAFLSLVENTDAQIRKILKNIPKNTKFMVFHPSWGYFAQAYGLVQLPVEVAGKEPKPRELVQLIKEAKKEHVKAIFTQPEFSDNIARVMATELHIKVVKVSPLSADWSNNLIGIAHAIAASDQKNNEN